MKKTLFTITALGLLSLSSCKKDYSCVCTDSTDTETYPLKDMKKKDAKNACNTWGTLWSLGGGSCSLK